jgi:hypothetical protein
MEAHLAKPAVAVAVAVTVAVTVIAKFDEESIA